MAHSKHSIQGRPGNFGHCAWCLGVGMGVVRGRWEFGVLEWVGKGQKYKGTLNTLPIYQHSYSH